MHLRLLCSLGLLSAQVAHASEEILLFNGTDFSGWTFFLEEKDYNAGGKGEISDFATIKEGGVIEINPKLHGALMTERDYRNYKLHLEWRWPHPDSQASMDSGVFLRIRPPFVWDTVNRELAALYQVQVNPSNTGDLWVLGGYSQDLLETDPTRSFQPVGELSSERGGHPRRHLKLKDAERPIGEWNELDVLVEGPHITVHVNGELVNQGTNLADVPGRIGLESERGTIQFRNIRLTPLARSGN